VLYLDGRPDEARERAQEALARPEAGQRPHGVVYALATLALVEVDAGRSHLAETSARRALEVASATGLASSWSAALAHTALAAALLGTHELGAAEREALRGEELRRSPEPSVEHTHALLVLVETRLARRRRAAAAPELEVAREALETFVDAGRLPAQAARLADALRTSVSNGEPPGEPPSPAELAVLTLLATDLTQRQIGKELFLSLNTVKTHTRSLYRKLGASSREEATGRASELGLLEAPAKVAASPRVGEQVSD
jgi:LuxR family maltose regulon positive regulatory protein